MTDNHHEPEETPRPAQTRPLQMRAQETRARILAASEAAFAASGYDRTSVAEVCERAGVTKGAFYHHFESKQAVFLQLLENWLADMDTRLTVLESGETAVPAQLVAMTGVLGHVLNAASGQLTIYLEYLMQALRDPALAEATRAPYRSFHARIAGLVRRGIDEGSLQPALEPDAVAGAILALVMGLLVQALLDPDATDWAQASAQGMRMLLAGNVKE